MSEDKIKREIRKSISQEDDIEEEYEDEFIDILDSRYTKLDFDESPVLLQRMQIRGFRAITNLELPFTDQNKIIHGKNSKGKSSFIEATRFNLIGRDDDNPLVTDPIHEDYDKLETDSYWSKDGINYKIHREMENGGGYKGHHEPNIVKNPSENEVPISQRQTQADVNNLIGYTPLYERGFDEFDVFSLHSVITGELRNFYNCDDASDLIDILFGITVTNVERKIKEELRECQPDKEERQAKVLLLERQQRASRLNDEIRSLQTDQEGTEKEIAEKTTEREELSRLIENKDEVSENLSEKIDIKDDISDLQTRRDEKQEEFGSIKQAISKLESEAVTEEVAPALQEMKQLVAVPNQCPICTTEISPSNHEQFHKEGDCPLCGEEVPQKRYDTVSEVEEKSRVDEKERRHEELEELEARRRQIKGEIEFLNEEIEEKKQRLQELEKKEEESKFSEYKRRKETLEDEIGQLQEQSRKIELRIEARREKLHEVARNVWQWKQLNEERIQKEQRQKTLKAFQDLLIQEQKEARKRVQNRLRQRMESLLKVFTRGTFETATGVTFREDDSYKYTVHTTGRTESKPELLEETNAELTLHMLLFHIAVLAELQEERSTLPLNLVLIDSPYGNGQDDENAPDITDFLLEMTEVLNEYQIVVAMADSNLADQERLQQGYELSAIVDYIGAEKEKQD
ncbi:hypothetical protein HYG81_21490 (plasmid) [Natrinema zhouii]|uniref:AAA family ATPase n=1 Tax=Natrinema zhouii TaxID=1710539 RepID=UPI001D001910|nr:AAA family ATPase [Natrinema zhouii]UHQ98151.1 hypothetical protein HYG81_21490 [Natrinema zhouii]